MTPPLDQILRASASRHKHLCPRQVLGARMGLLAGEILCLDLPRPDKRLIVTAETDGCTVDGIIASTGCHVGGRTLRILDFGRIAATFTDVKADASIRIAPSRAARTLALEYAPEAANRWQAMLRAYQVMPADDLFTVQRVQLDTPIAKIISNPKRKVFCDICGEEVFNGREQCKDGALLCLACAGEGYYHILAPSQLLTQVSPLNHRE
jgi:formylmethanofuran dehydrogenase subunit E